MPEPTLDDLRATLREHADVLVPDLPLMAVGDRLAARRARRLRLAAIGAAAAVLLTILVAAGVAQRPSSAPDPVPPIETQTATPTATPSAAQNLDDLPVGNPTTVAYATGTVLHVGPDVQVDLGFTLAGFQRSGDQVIAWDGDGRIASVDLTAGGSPRVRQLDSHGGIDAVTDGIWAAWTRDVPGKLAVRVHHLQAPYESFDRNIPDGGDGGPQCCDDPYYVNGFTEDGVLVMSRPSYGRIWQWRVGSHFDNSSPLGRPAVLITGIPQDASIARMHGYDMTLTLNGGGVQVGAVPPEGSWEPSATIPEVDTVFLGDPEDTRAIQDTRSGGGWHVVPYLARGGQDHPADLLLGLPESVVVDAVTWEDADHVVLAVLGSDATIAHLVRCKTTQGACELAGPLTNATTLLSR